MYQSHLMSISHGDWNPWQGTALVDAAESLVGLVVYGVLHGAMWGTWPWRGGGTSLEKPMGKSQGRNQVWFWWCWKNMDTFFKMSPYSSRNMEDFNTLVSTLIKVFSLSIFGWSQRGPKGASALRLTLWRLDVIEWQSPRWIKSWLWNQAQNILKNET